MQTIKGIIFDFDGVILDTEVADYAAWQEVYRRHNAILHKNDWVTIIGTSGASFNVMDCLQSQVNHLLDASAIRAQKHEIYLGMIAGEQPMPGVTDLIAAARRAGLKLAIASSSPADWVHGHLRTIGLQDQFDVICTANDVKRVKPDPALFLLAASRLGLTPAEVIVIEDSYHGVAAAAAADIKAVAVPNDMTMGLDFSQADAVIGSLADQDLSGLLRLVGGTIQV